MSIEKKVIKSFTDLTVWREGHKLVMQIYRITDSFPDSQKFSLANQMQRSSVSITSNIAEGFARRGKSEKIQFYHLALGSLAELQSQLLIARDLGYCPREVSGKIASQTVLVSKLLNGLVKSAKGKEIHNT